MWLSSGEWASVPLLDGVTAASRSKAPRRGRRRVTSAFTLGRISFEKSMKPLRGFFDLGLESFLALAAGLAMVKSAGGAAVREGRAARVGSTARRAGRGCGARRAATALSGSNRSGGRARAARARKIQQAQSADISSPRQRQAGAAGERE